MNIKGFKRMLFGEKMPDKDDPQYKERYEREVQAGHKFAKATRIDQAAAKVQGFANAHRTLFLVIVFTFVIGAFAWNAYRLVTVYRHSIRVLLSSYSSGNWQNMATALHYYSTVVIPKCFRTSSSQKQRE